jgi:L-alanine-DL-glutamate epimerase-like enolase superfamily enzyme
MMTALILITNWMRSVHSTAHIPAGPGLGIEIDEDVVKEYRVEKFPRK